MAPLTRRDCVAAAKQALRQGNRRKMRPRSPPLLPPGLPLPPAPLSWRHTFAHRLRSSIAAGLEPELRHPAVGCTTQCAAPQRCCPAPAVQPKCHMQRTAVASARRLAVGRPLRQQGALMLQAGGSGCRPHPAAAAAPGRQAGTCPRHLQVHALRQPARERSWDMPASESCHS